MRVPLIFAEKCLFFAEFLVFSPPKHGNIFYTIKVISSRVVDKYEAIGEKVRARFFHGFSFLPHVGMGIRQ